jgi:hypothetical protein
MAALGRKPTNRVGTNFVCFTRESGPPFRRLMDAPRSPNQGSGPRGGAPNGASRFLSPPLVTTWPPRSGPTATVDEPIIAVELHPATIIK